jgi:hypothetical protein
MAIIGSDLKSWSEVHGGATWGGILLGNGASIAVWPDFKYSSLYSVACSNTIPNPLTGIDQQVFDALGPTSNFEFVLNGLHTARTIDEAMGRDPAPVIARYSSIQMALAQAVHKVHIPWTSTPAATLAKIRQHLLEYRFVFSTNYDLLVYWAVMERMELDSKTISGPSMAFSMSQTQAYLARTLGSSICMAGFT